MNVIDILIRARDKTKGAFGAVGRWLGQLGHAASGAVTAALGSLMSLISSGLTGAITILIGAVVGLIGALVFLAPVIYAVVGAGGAMITMLFGLIGAAAVLKIGLSGVGDALKEMWTNGRVTEQTLRKLTPAARDFVKAFSGLRGRYQILKKLVQENLFEGLGQQIRLLAFRWMPVLNKSLWKLAAGINYVFQWIGNELRDFDFISNISIALDYFDQFITKVGKGVSQLIPAFGRIARAAGPFLLELGMLISDLLTKFNEFITRVDESGALNKFFQKAAASFRDLLAIIGRIFTILGTVIAILFPTSEKVSDSVFDGVRLALDKIQTWLDNPENQNKIRAFFDKIMQFLQDMPKHIAEAKKFTVQVRGIVDSISSLVARVTAIGQAVGRALNTMKTQAASVTNSIAGFFQALPVRILLFFVSLPTRLLMIFAGIQGRFTSVGANIVSGIGQGMLNRWPWLAGLGAGLATRLLRSIQDRFGISSPSKVFAEQVGRWIPEGIAVGIDKYAGVAERAMGQFGPGGGGAAGGMAGGGRGGGMALEIHSGGSQLDDLLVELLRRSVRVRGGNVQAVLGRA